GPQEDAGYWTECESLIARLPGNIEVRYCGFVPSEGVGEVMRQHDLYLLPTLGENFGHGILEALANGCPVLISDRTPWRGLEAQGVGWDLPLDQPERFRQALRQCLGMSAAEHRVWSERACEFGVQYNRREDLVELNRALF